MAARRTQTNEAARCAVLLPALALLPGPLALIVVGASAGLTLLVDRYSYDYEGHLVAGADPQAPVLRCRPSGPVPLPSRPGRAAGPVLDMFADVRDLGEATAAIGPLRALPYSHARVLASAGRPALPPQ